MKRLIFAIICLLANDLPCKAQLPEKVFHTMGKNQFNYPHEWLHAQVDAWKYEKEKNPKNAEAWMNYYFATAYTLLKKRHENSGTTSRGSIFKIAKDLKDLSDADAAKTAADTAITGVIFREMEQEVPNSFEYKYLKYRRTRIGAALTPANMKLLDDAYTTDPDRVEAYPDLVKAYELKRELPMRDQMLKRWYESGDISEGFLNYSYNMLMSVEKNGFLVVRDYDQVFCLLVLQQVMNIRKDISVICAEWLKNDNYRKKIYAECGIKETPFDGPDLTFIIPKSDIEGYTSNLSTDAFFNDLVYNKKGRTVYGAKSIVEGNPYLTKKAYLVGLAYKISDERFDNIAVMRKNFEQNFALDYLRNSFYIEKYPDDVNTYNNDYLVPMLHLYDHYVFAGETDKANRMRELVLNIGPRGGQQKSVETYLQKYK